MCIRDRNKTLGVALNGQPIIKNPIGEIDVDIMIEEATDTPTIQSEQFERFMQLATAIPSIMQEITPVDILKMSDLPNKQDIIEKIEERREERAKQGPNPQLQMALAEKKAEIGETQASTELKKAQAQKTLSEIGKMQAQIKDMETKALKMVNDAIEGPQLQDRKFRIEEARLAQDLSLIHI